MLMMKIGTESACKLKLLGHLHIHDQGGERDNDDDDYEQDDDNSDGDVDADMGGMMESNITGILRGMCVPPPSALSQPALTSARNCHQHRKR